VLDVVAYPAIDLARLHHDRWQAETGIADLKTAIRSGSHRYPRRQDDTRPGWALDPEPDDTTPHRPIEPEPHRYVKFALIIPNNNHSPRVTPALLAGMWAGRGRSSLP
jgi:hypothetical protein